MRDTLIVGNWKMNGSLVKNAKLLDDLLADFAPRVGVKMVLCASSPYWFQLQAKLSGGDILWGAQNLNEHANGAYSGEVSASMLQEFGGQYAILGHSERRRYFAETDAVIAQKFIATQKAGIVPILCIGENSLENERGVVQSVLDKQLDAVLSAVPLRALGDFVISYEPIWAIGTGKVASPDMVQAVHAYIRAKLAFYDVSVAKRVSILYGGSVNPSNAGRLLTLPDVDGVLVGAASLQATDFLAIYQQANELNWRKS